MSQLSTQSQPQFQAHADGEVDLKELVQVLSNGKLWIICATVIAAVLSVSFALWLPNIYRAEALLAIEDSDSDPMSDISAQYGDLASLAGVALPSGGADRGALGIAILQSRIFLSQFVQRHDALPALMAADDWDMSSNTLSYDGDLYDAGAQKWVRNVDPPRKPEPSAQEAFKVFSDILIIDQDPETGFIMVTIEHLSPSVAQQWVTWLIKDLNDTVREQDVAEAERSIAYLQKQLQATQMSDLRGRFYGMIQSQTETVMMANARPEYLFKIIDPAVEPEEKYKPQRSLICILGTILGAALGVFAILVRHYVFGTSQGKSAREDF